MAQFIARDTPFYAAALVRQARAAALSLNKSSHRGGIPECDDPTIREIFLKSFRLIYQTTDDTIFILAFVHGARDLAALWPERH